jgi:regulator of cell morphogenesis and NO signaling
VAGLYDGLAAFERDLHRHVHLENNLLFPRAIALEKEALAVR